jgi:hypothetical protein
MIQTFTIELLLVGTVVIGFIFEDDLIIFEKKIIKKIFKEVKR